MCVITTESQRWYDKLLRTSYDLEELHMVKRGLIILLSLLLLNALIPYAGLADDRLCRRPIGTMLCTLAVTGNRC